MIILGVTSGTGNQLFQYAMIRCLAHKLNTEFKLDITRYQKPGYPNYALNLFNTHEELATPEEIEQLNNKEHVKVEPNRSKYIFFPEALNYPDNVYILGSWESERYFADIADIIREEFTLKNPLSSNAEAWKQKILSSECPISLHVRRGDFLHKELHIFAVPPLSYYYESINKLKQQYKNLTVFLFSNDLNWCKEHFILDVPTEFVSGCQKDVEDLYLMSICDHNIISNGTFSWWGAWLNKNPDKQVFVPIPSYYFGTKNTYRHFSTERIENSSLDTDRWIKVPFDINKRLNLYLDQADNKNSPINVKIPPIFSLVLVVNNDAATIAETLDSLFNQDYKYYEIVIIDNASTDGSEKICRDAIAGKNNVIFRKLYSKVKISEAYNIAINMVQGQYVSFLKGNDRLLSNALTALYLAHGNQNRDILHSFTTLRENPDGRIPFGDKKVSVHRHDVFFNKNNERRGAIMSDNGYDAVKLLTSQQINDFLATKIFNRNFLKEHGIKFDEKLAEDEAELFFQIECFFKSKYFMYVVNGFYIVP